MTETESGQRAPVTETQRRPRSGPRTLAIALAAQERARFRAEVERAKAGDRSVSVAAQAIACAEMGR